MKSWLQEEDIIFYPGDLYEVVEAFNAIPINHLKAFYEMHSFHIPEQFRRIWCEKGKKFLFLETIEMRGSYITESYSKILIDNQICFTHDVNSLKKKVKYITR